jgi:hypothetical protein
MFNLHGELGNFLMKFAMGERMREREDGREREKTGERERMMTIAEVIRNHKRVTGTKNVSACAREFQKLI